MCVCTHTHTSLFTNRTVSVRSQASIGHLRPGGQGLCPPTVCVPSTLGLSRADVQGGTGTGCTRHRQRMGSSLPGLPPSVVCPPAWCAPQHSSLFIFSSHDLQGTVKGWKESQSPTSRGFCRFLGWAALLQSSLSIGMTFMVKGLSCLFMANSTADHSPCLSLHGPSAGGLTASRNSSLLWGAGLLAGVVPI